MAGGPIFPNSIYLGGAAGRLFPNYHVGAGANPSIPIPDYGYPAYSIPMKAFPEWGAAVAAAGRGMSVALIVRRRR